MRRKGSQVGGNVKPALPESAEQNNATALQRTLDNNGEELLWIAEVMAGSRQAGEQCLAEAVELAEQARYIGREWMLSLVKRLLVHVVLKQISGEIRKFLMCRRSPMSVGLAKAGLSASERQKLRSISPQWIIESCDVFERSCLILFSYLQYPLLDCALLLGCSRALIEPICECMLPKAAGLTGSSQNAFRAVGSFASQEVCECAG